MKDLRIIDIAPSLFGLLTIIFLGFDPEQISAVFGPFLGLSALMMLFSAMLSLAGTKNRRVRLINAALLVMVLFLLFSHIVASGHLY